MEKHLDHVDRQDGGGSQAEHVASRAMLAVRDDLEGAAADAVAVATDGFAFIVKGLRLIDGTGTHDDDVTRHLASARLWPSDAAQRRDRAELLRGLAGVLEGDVPPTAETLESIIPDALKDRLLTLALESRASARLAGINLPSRAQLQVLHESMFSTGGVDRFLRLLKTIKFAALGLLRN